LATSGGKYQGYIHLPGDVHSALVANGVIAHPYIGRNEDAVQWVAQEDWLVSRTFEMPALYPEGGWYLDIDYLDTIADVRVNGDLVLSAKNCFRRYRPDVSKVLKPGRNTIEILFHSNPKAANELQASMPFYIPYSSDNCPIPNVNMLRKPQCHFGWDWNIAIAPLGLYGRIELKRHELTRIEHVQTQQFHGDGFVDLTVTVQMEARAKR
jgi:beta-mannosidase